MPMDNIPLEHINNPNAPFNQEFGRLDKLKERGAKVGIGYFGYRDEDAYEDAILEIEEEREEEAKIKEHAEEYARLLEDISIHWKDLCARIERFSELMQKAEELPAPKLRIHF